MKFLAATHFVVAFLSATTIALASPTAALEQRSGTAYEDGLPTDPSYFPIGVYLQSPSRAPQYKAIGINLFVGLWQGPTEPQLAELARYNMPVITAQNEVALRSPNAKMIRGWMQDDEPDNAQPHLIPFFGTCVPAKVVAAHSVEIKAKDPTRPVLIEFGRGAADPNWRGRGRCTGDTAYYNEAAIGADILSFDIYPVASGDDGELDFPSRGVTRLRAAAQEGQRVWATIETTHIRSRTARVTPAQLRSEVLLALIQGANGLVYFVHEWTGGFREDGLFRYPEIVEAVRETNARIKGLAAVLNSPTIEGRVTTSGSISSATMLKEHDGALYLFAGSTVSEGGSVTFSLSGLVGGTAQVIGENRQLSISNGHFSDSFSDAYDVHAYRISRGDAP